MKEPKPMALIADDEEPIRTLLERFLAKQGFEVQAVLDGVAALETLKQDNFDLLILDLRMPKMDGMELLSKIRELQKELIIIIITGYATVETAKEAMKQGCFDYITKPFDVEELGLLIKRAFELKRVTREKEKLQENLRITQKLASLGELGSCIIHEVNTVLTSTRLFLEMLRPKLPTLKESENVMVVLEEIERIEKLIEKFIDFAKPTEPEFKITDINSVLKKSLQFFGFRFDKQGIQVVEALTPSLKPVYCDPAEMEEVFLNIFSNSIDAMPGGGALSIKSYEEEGKIVLTISDTGVGIPAENLEKLFMPFFTTKPQGNGLGLSIVHRIIDKHKGFISISSQENAGTIVRIELPVFSPELISEAGPQVTTIDHCI